MRHPLFARFYRRLVLPAMARSGGDDLRRRTLEGLRGTVVEVGAGDGVNFPLYPDEVDHVVAVEPESYLREKAASRADERVRLLDGTSAHLPLEDATADAIVFALVLCSLDVGTALAEARRVLRPGGELRFLEHVRAPEPGATRKVQSALDATVWPLLFGGCHCGRDTEADIEAAGFEVSEIARFSFPEGSRGPESSFILGRARVRAA